jgi:hypothetical protein
VVLGTLAPVLVLAVTAIAITGDGAVDSPSTATTAVPAAAAPNAAPANDPRAGAAREAGPVRAVPGSLRRAIDDLETAVRP